MKLKCLLPLIVLMMIGCLEEPQESQNTNSSLVQPLTTSEPPNFTENLTLMQGNWEAPNGTEISVDGNKYEETNRAGEKKSAILEAYSNCPNFCADKNQDVSAYACFILKENNSAQCYVIFKLDKEELQFSTMGGKPKIRVFRRVTQ